MKKLICIILCAALLSGFSCAFADDGARPCLDNDELTALVDSVLDELGFNKSQVSVGFYASATDETWYYNEDLWLYSASLFKVPLIMLLDQKLAAGEVAQDGMIGRFTVDFLKEKILQYSSNSHAYLVQNNVWGDEVEFRREAMSLAEMDEDEYSEKYLSASYFNVRFMTQIMQNLYFNCEEYPDIIGHLLLAQPKHYFKTHLEDTYEIAQKYGSFSGVRHTSGIIYTPNPIILTVLTANPNKGEVIITAIADAFAEFAVELDERIEEYDRQEAARIEAEAKAKAAEEEKAKLEAEQRTLETAAEAEPVTTDVESAAPRSDVKCVAENETVIAVIIAIVVLSALLALAVKRKKK